MSKQAKRTKIKVGQAIIGEALLAPQFADGLVITERSLVTDKTGQLWIIEPRTGVVKRPKVRWPKLPPIEAAEATDET